MKKFPQLLSLLLVLALLLGFCSCKKADGDLSSGKVTTNEDITETVNDISKNTTAENTSAAGGKDNASQNHYSENSGGSKPAQSNTSAGDQNTQGSEEFNPNAGSQPQVNLCARVASNIYIIGGVCSKNTEYILVSGSGVTETKINTVKGKDNNYFTGQVYIDYPTIMEIQGKESGKDLSSKVKRAVSPNANQQNMMIQGDYKPVFGLDSRSHYYSAILTYTLSNFLTQYEKEYAGKIIGETVSAAKDVGAEVIYLVVPSSAAVYPETLPAEYKAATGETLYTAFKSVAEKNGAKVLYPLDTMKAHKNDGDGFKIYSHTDSHWTTYGAYLGVAELMNYISGKYPSAKPRSVAEMNFYTAELYGGDMLFSFGDGNGFENYSQANANGGETKITGIKELTTLYSLKMPTDTLSKITRNKKSVYLTKDNEQAKTEINPNGAGLPTAVVVRDSFGRTAYDMINDRFSTVNWLAENNFSSIAGEIYQNRPNYVIYIISERNLLKVMLGNQNISLTKYS